MRAVEIHSMLIGAEEHVIKAIHGAQKKREALPKGDEFRWELLELESELHQAGEHLARAQAITGRLRVEEAKQRQ